MPLFVLPSAVFLEDSVKRHLKLEVLLYVSYIKCKVMEIILKTFYFNADLRKESWLLLCFTSGY